MDEFGGGKNEFAFYFHQVSQFFHPSLVKKKKKKKENTFFRMRWLNKTLYFSLFPQVWYVTRVGEQRDGGWRGSSSKWSGNRGICLGIGFARSHPWFLSHAGCDSRDDTTYHTMLRRCILALLVIFIILVIPIGTYNYLSDYWDISPN